MTHIAVARVDRASHFCFGKNGQNHCAGHDGFADVVSAQLPLVLAARAPARTRPTLASNMRALLARSTARRGVMQRRVFHFVTGHPGLDRSEVEQYAPSHPTRMKSTGKGGDAVVRASTNRLP
ncbi:MAG: hypothetical protein KGJ94_09305 [Xanthomonadaceae bacterium]|nr:hypothetical protein [Xanthomonadaceae bacterium]